jgi:hypothetical protein
MNQDWHGFGWQSTAVPQTPLDDRQRAKHGIPLTLRPVRDPQAVQQPVFDPALKQYPNAYRAADPRFTDPAVGDAWYAARRRATDLVLAAVAGSAWADHLVLRGSMLLHSWFGDAAREPGDLDFVVVPRDWRIEEPRTAEMFDGIAHAAERAAGSGPVRLIASDAVSEDIWTYDRVPGRRLMLPWTADGLPGGVVQLDIVFNERLPTAPERALVPSLAGGGPGATVYAVTAGLSLAWKLMWLICDCYPMGKDLYDAVLLAESCRLRYEDLRDVFLDAELHHALRPVTASTVAELAGTVEWQHFAQEYPQIGGDAAEYVDRLTAALAPTFDSAAGNGTELERWWVAPWITEYRRVLDGEGMSGLQKRLAAAGGHPSVAIRLTREVLGQERCTLDDACAAVLGDPAWSESAAFYARHPDWLREHLAQL